MIKSRCCRVTHAKADSNTAPLCNDCRDRVAEIFQVNGEYCLRCWQEKTYPDVKTNSMIE
jgi:hypothetical protein